MKSALEKHVINICSFIAISQKWLEQFIPTPFLKQTNQISYCESYTPFQSPLQGDDNLWPMTYQTILHDKNPVAAQHGVQPVSYNQHGTLDKCFFNCRLHKGVSLGVNCRCRLVQHQDLIQADDKSQSWRHILSNQATCSCFWEF